MTSQPRPRFGERAHWPRSLRLSATTIRCVRQRNGLKLADILAEVTRAKAALQHFRTTSTDLIGAAH
jgi:hypothetical protein